jgi:RHS repeat-associated protein
MKKNIIFFEMLMFCLFFSNKSYSQSVDVNIGTESANFEYTDVRYNTECNNYELTITRPMRLSINTTIFNDVFMGAWLDFYCVSGDAICDSNIFYSSEYIHGKKSNEFYAIIETDLLPAGTYTIASNGHGCGDSFQVFVNGSVRNIFKDSTPIGNFDNNFTYTDTQNTDNYWADYNAYGISGDYGNDIFYQFTLNRQMDVVISHCGSDIDNTYLYLLDSSGKCIASSNASGEGKCPSNNAYLKKEDLSSGTYYVVSEGYTSGNITTTVNGIIPYAGFDAGQNQNYILEITPTVESSDTRNLSLNQSIQKVQYYDGLGRPSQNVQRGITPSGKDLVTIQEYDNYGRESNSWLPTPYSGSGSYTDPAAIKSEAIMPTVYNDNSPYSSPVYEASPLNRVLEKYGPGASWRSVVGLGHSVKSAFLANDNTNDSLRCAYYYVTSDNKLVKSRNYDNCQLYVTRIIDEDNHIAFEFKDKLGQVVLTRQVNNGFNDTYYVYDDFGNKCFVLPPSAADALTDNTYTGTEDALTTFAYIYRYDSRNRCIYKKLPGADPIYMIYDKADHLIFSQDGEQRSKMPKEWTFSIPDVFNRTIVTGICTDTISVKNIVLNGSFVNGNNGFMNTGYQLSNQINACTRLLTVDYYDNYDYKSLLTDTIKSKLEYTALDGYAEKYVNAVPEISTKGMLTGTRVFMLEEPAKEIITAMYYDDRGRLAQSKATNHLGGYEKDYFLYTFTGKIKKHQHIHNVPGKTTITEVNENFYDNGERLTKTTHSLNGSTPVTLAENTYDEMGRLNSKKLHGGVETTNYSYNIRSWLKSITTEKSRFSEALYYNESSNGSLKYYNGNISAMNWKVQNENYQRSYSFDYDDLNRITKADYQDNETNSDKNYSTSYAYDKMGNIKNLIRYGLSAKPSTFGMIDNLTLNYNGNQLSSVVEASLKDDEPHYSGAFNFVDSLSKQIEYKYDANGNLTGDLNKKISKIQYNSLNLPSAMQFCYGNTIDYLYDASGVKRKVKYVTTTENLYVELGNTLPISADKVKFTTQTDYCGNVIYENGTLSRILVDGGHITMSGTTPTYHYYIQDHQGNNRVVFNQNGTVEQTNHYYPFGMTFGEGVDNSDNRYKYNGKELDRMHGLDLYDYGARHFDAAIGRWGVMDPLAENGYEVSPYVYCHNNPIFFIDPYGLWESTSGGYQTNDKKDIEQFLSYYQTEQAISDKTPSMNQMLSFIGEVKDSGHGKLSNGAYLLSDIFINSTTSGNWNVDKRSLNNVWNEVEDIRSGGESSGGFFNCLNNFSSIGGLGADISKATGTFGSIGVWKNYSKMHFYSSGWMGNGTVKTFGTASAVGYGMYGLSIIANWKLYEYKKQSGLETGINLGISTLMLRMPLPISIGYGVGSTAGQIQQSAFKTLIQNGYGDNPGLFNEDFLH